jgi:glycosyltransferase involved in cell wall biosynthesis
MSIAKLPRITVVTPSFQQAQFLGKTIESVLDQNYPDLEYFVVDGGSSDGSVDTIRRYASKLSWWTSEADRGQSHAINKGLSRATGDVLCWLNSDDYFAPDTLRWIGELFSHTSAPKAVAGDCVRLFDDGRPARHDKGQSAALVDLLSYWRPYAMHQPSIFWNRAVFDRVGLLREDLHLIMDFEYWVRIAEVCSFEYVPRVLSYSHFHKNAKTADDFQEYTLQRKRYSRQLWEQRTLAQRARLRAAEMTVNSRAWLRKLMVTDRAFS